MRDLALGANRLLDPFRSRLHTLVRAAAGVSTRSGIIGGDHWSWIEAGPADGDPIVLLHGFAGSKDNWMFIVPTLARRFRVICPDLPGFRESGAAASDDYTIGRQAERVIGFLEALDIGPCHLGGNSMGGFIALKVVLNAPEKVRSLMLLNNAGVDGEETTAAQDALKTGHDLFDIRNADDVGQLLPLLFHRPPYVPRFLRSALAARLSQRHALEHRIFEQVLRDAVDGKLNDQLGEIAVPTLVLWGDSDRLLHVSAAYTQNAGIADSELVVLERAGHVPMIERPCRTARIMRSFVTRRGQPASG